MNKRLNIVMLLAFLSGLLFSVIGVPSGFPEHFPPPAYDLSKSTLNKDKIELGRAMFYDPIFSGDSTISCASCHSPYNGFSHTDHDLSHGIRDQIGKRNAPALFNLAWQSEFGWDGSINHLDVFALAPIIDSTEMASGIEEVVAKLQASGRYPAMFERAFGDSVVTGQHVLKALAQFQLTLVSATAKYDSVQRGESEFNAQEMSGYRLYQENCASCHAEPLFSTYEFANNGLLVDSTLRDQGRKIATGKNEDLHQFKIPSLRNLAFTYPYMHDGRFKRLSQVLKHYTDGITESATLAEALRGGVKLSDHDKADLLAFLLTLNDRAFVFDPKHQFPQKIFFPGEGN